MLHKMNIAPTLNTGEPCAEYYESLRHAAATAVKASEAGSREAFSLCEYLDCVDSAACVNTVGIYQECVSMLTSYLESCPRTHAQRLADKSWAAKTLLELIHQANERTIAVMHKA